MHLCTTRIAFWVASISLLRYRKHPSQAHVTAQIIQQHTDVNDFSMAAGSFITRNDQTLLKRLLKSFQQRLVISFLGGGVVGAESKNKIKTKGS
jgi:hypothetical protein